MDPITLIITALVTGTANLLKDTVVKDAYNGLKELIQKRLSGKQKAETTLADFEQDPDTYDKPLKKVLTEGHVDQDADVLTAAQKLLSLAHPEEAALGKFTIRISGGQGIVIGDHATPTMYFGDHPTSEEKGQ